MAKQEPSSSIQTWTVTEPYLNVHCALGEGPYYEPATHTFRFVDIKKHRLHVIDLNAGPDSLQTIQLDMPVGVTADIEGIDPQEKILIGGKKGIAVLDRTSEKYEYLQKWYDVVEDERDFRLRSNDGSVDPAGRFWIGTMNDFTVPKNTPEGMLFRIDPDLSRHVIRQDITIPNGIGWSPSQKIMYFTHSTEQTIFAYDYDVNTGAATNPRPFWKLEGSSSDPDGFKIDKDGYIWSAVYGDGKVLKISPEGKIVGEIKLPTRNITCPTFVGEDLFITTAAEADPEKYPESAKYGGGLFKVHVGVTGLPDFKFKLEKKI